MRNLATSIFDYLGLQERLFLTGSCLQPPPNVRSLLPQSAFLNLPSELRLTIYSHVFRDSKIWVDPEPEFSGDFTFELGQWLKRKRRRAEFGSNKRWPVLLTCRTCYQEARQLFVEATRFFVRDSNQPIYRTGTLIQFAETVSEFSKLNLVELWEFLGRGYSERDTPAWMHKHESALLCIQAIPLFPSIRTCVLSTVICDHINRQESPYVWDQMTGFLTERDTERILHKMGPNDMVLGRFIQLVRDDEYSYMRHIDFLLVVRMKPCARFFSSALECSPLPTRYLFEATCFINIGQRTGYLQRDDDIDEEEGLSRVRRYKTM